MEMTEKQKSFVTKVAGYAVKDKRILPSLTIAQAILESGWGQSGLTRNANALFGIKANSGWKGKVYSATTKECYDGVNYTTITDVFRAYDSWEESVNDHTAFLCGLTRYKKVVNEKNYKTACKAIKAAGYATAPNYAEQLISIIEQYELYRYDADSTYNATAKPAEPAKPDTGKTTTSTTGGENERTYTVMKGDTLTKISKKYGVSIDAIVTANKNKYTQITRDYIQAGWKLKVPVSYVVVRGDTLTKIARKYGTSIDKIVADNKAKYSKITPDYIQAGWVLNIW